MFPIVVRDASGNEPVVMMFVPKDSVISTVSKLDVNSMLKIEVDS